MGRHSEVGQRNPPVAGDPIEGRRQVGDVDLASPVMPDGSSSREEPLATAATLDAAVPMDFTVGVVFGLAEALTIIGAGITLIILARMTSRSSQADAGQSWLQRQRYPLIDVFICTYNEEQSILDTTIIAALGMKYPNFRVWVLDDGNRGWLEAHCKHRGCEYLRRSDNTHAKAGNINHALMHVIRLPTPPAFVAILDADFAPMAEFLSRAAALRRSIFPIPTPFSRTFWSTASFPTSSDISSTSSWRREMPGAWRSAAARHP